MGFNKLQYTLMQKAIRKQLTMVKANKTWLEIYEKYCIGKLTSKNNLVFTINDLNIMRKIVDKHLSLDPLFDDLKGDRLSLSKRCKNEKINGTQVFGNYIQVAKPNNMPIHLFDGDAVTPKNTVLTLIDNTIDFKKHSSVLIIENGTNFINWSAIKLPIECDDSLIIYRGHGKSLKAVHNLLKEMPDNCTKYTFFDYDPSGIGMSLRMRADAMLIPKNYLDIHKNKSIMKLNKDSTHHKQWVIEGEYISKNSPEFLKQAIINMEKYDIALTQETIVSCEIDLVVKKI